MPISFHLDHTSRLVRSTVVGDSTAEEMVEVIRRVADQVGGPGYHVLSDHCEIGEPATRPQLDAIVGTLKNFQKVFAHARWAVVVSKPASFGMMRVLMVLGERIPITVRIFRDFDEAERWAICGD